MHPAATPALEGTWFNDVVAMIKQANRDGDTHFKYITHTLACTECIDAGVPQKCIHNLGNLPPWKSICKLAQIRRLYPKKLQREFETEVLGCGEEGSESYINGALLDALRDKPRFVLGERETFSEIWVGVDPLSHGRSEMGLCALGYSAHGEKVIIGIAAVPTVRPMLVEVKVGRHRPRPSLGAPAKARLLTPPHCPPHPARPPRIPGARQIAPRMRALSLCPNRRMARKNRPGNPDPPQPIHSAHTGREPPNPQQ